MLFLLVIAVVFGFTSGRNKVRNLQAEISVVFENDENLLITSKTVDNLLIQNLGDVEKQDKSSIDLQELENLVRSHPMVSSADVSIGVKGGIEVAVRQRKPLARLFNEKEVVYLDSQGNEMPLSKNYSARVPVINNKNGLLAPKEVFPLVQNIDADPFLKKLVVAIKKNKEGIWLSTRVNHQQVLLGDLKDLHKKLKKLKVFYTYMEQDSVSNAFRKIDLQYNNQVVCLK